MDSPAKSFFFFFGKCPAAGQSQVEGFPVKTPPTPKTTSGGLQAATRTAVHTVPDMADAVDDTAFMEDVKVSDRLMDTLLR